jgi:hypothetical protein
MDEYYSARGTETQLLREDMDLKESTGEIDTMRSDDIDIDEANE